MVESSVMLLWYWRPHSAVHFLLVMQVNPPNDNALIYVHLLPSPSPPSSTLSRLLLNLSLLPLFLPLPSPEASRAVPLRGGQRPERGRGGPRPGAPEAVRAARFPGVLAARGDPRGDLQLPKHHSPLPHPGTLQSLPSALLLHRGRPGSRLNPHLQTTLTLARIEGHSS